MVAGVNIREQSERRKRLRIIKIITERQMLTVSQTANLLDISASEAKALLNGLYRESRISINNRSEDMAVVYTPIE